MSLDPYDIAIVMCCQQLLPSNWPDQRKLGNKNLGSMAITWTNCTPINALSPMHQQHIPLVFLIVHFVTLAQHSLLLESARHIFSVGIAGKATKGLFILDLKFYQTRIIFLLS
jgi:hypothetical protein